MICYHNHKEIYDVCYNLLVEVNVGEKSVLSRKFKELIETGKIHLESDAINILNGKSKTKYEQLAYRFLEIGNPITFEIDVNRDNILGIIYSLLYSLIYNYDNRNRLYNDISRIGKIFKNCDERLIDISEYNIGLYVLNAISYDLFGAYTYSVSKIYGFNQWFRVLHDRYISLKRYESSDVYTYIERLFKHYLNTIYTCEKCKTNLVNIVYGKIRKHCSKCLIQHPELAIDYRNDDYSSPENKFKKLIDKTINELIVIYQQTNSPGMKSYIISYLIAVVKGYVKPNKFNIIVKTIDDIKSKSPYILTNYAKYIIELIASGKVKANDNNVYIIEIPLCVKCNKRDQSNPLKHNVCDICVKDYAIEKRKEVLLEKYNVETPIKVKEFRQKAAETYSRTMRNKRYQTVEKRCESRNITMLFDKHHFIENLKVKPLKFRCNKCGTEFEWNEFTCSSGPWCPKCNNFHSSRMETDIYDMLTDIIKFAYRNDILNRKLTLKRNVRLTKPSQSDFESSSLIHILDYNLKKRYLNYLNNTHHSSMLYELDILIPEINFAIELHGTKWHSIDNLSLFNVEYPTHMNVNKYLNTALQNIILYVIYDVIYMRKSKQNIIRNHILKSLNMWNEKFGLYKAYARNLEIISTDNHSDYQLDEFFDKNHIFGFKRKAKYCKYIALKNNINILMAALFESNDGDKWELQRVCSKTNYLVVGGLSRIIKYFINVFKPKTLFTFSHAEFCNNPFNTGYYKSDVFNRICVQETFHVQYDSKLYHRLMLSYLKNKYSFKSQQEVIDKIDDIFVIPTLVYKYTKNHNKLDLATY